MAGQSGPEYSLSGFLGYSCWEPGLCTLSAPSGCNARDGGVELTVREKSWPVLWYSTHAFKAGPVEVVFLCILLFEKSLRCVFFAAGFRRTLCWVLFPARRSSLQGISMNGMVSCWRGRAGSGGEDRGTGRLLPSGVRSSFT